MFVKSAVTEKPSGMGDSCTPISVEVIFSKKYQKVSHVSTFHYATTGFLLQIFS